MFLCLAWWVVCGIKFELGMLFFVLSQVLTSFSLDFDMDVVLLV